MSLCARCKKNNAKRGSSAILNGEFYELICESCLNSTIQVTSGAARWERTIDAEDHEADIQQPYSADGSINRKFISLYPDKARAIFSEEQIRNANL